VNLRSFVLATAATCCALPLAAQSSTRRVQIFSETFSMAAHGPYFVRLDSGATYRLLREGPMSGDISVAPRSSFAAPIRFSAATMTGVGAPFVPASSGEYRIESSYAGSEVIQVRIFRDLSATECAGVDASQCTMLNAEAPPAHHRISPAVLVMLGLFPAFIFGVMRNGKNL
jgi:hypothetical protein